MPWSTLPSCPSAGGFSFNSFNPEPAATVSPQRVAIVSVAAWLRKTRGQYMVPTRPETPSPRLGRVLWWLVWCLPVAYLALIYGAQPADRLTGPSGSPLV